MDFVSVDFESFYDKEYSLKKLTTEQYVNDPRFELIGVGVQFNDKPPHWFTGTDIERVCRLPDWSKCALVAHNAKFDAYILAKKFGIHPAFIIDTMSMARPFHNANTGVSLAKLAAHYNLGVKGDEVVQAMGKRVADFSVAELAQYGEYCKNDVVLTYRLLQALLPRLPLSELRLIDTTIRMFTSPVLCLDTEMVQQEIDIEATRKAELLAMVDQPKGVFSSNAKFAEFLISLGVDPPMKDSPKRKNEDGTPLKVFAFAKGDADFIALQDHDDPLVAAAVEVRLGVKSTQRETRSARFMGIAQRNNGELSVPLAYYAAHTGRYGGDDKINLQNLQRTDKKDPTKGLLRKAITAREGELLIVEDLSQIEARLLVWQANQLDRVEAFANRRDVYSEQATVIFGRHVDRKKNDDDFIPGFIGKAVVLGCLGADTQVLTDTGWKSIVSVTGTDKLWDGEEWVTHLGVVEKGVKPTLEAYGLTATGDHEILTEHGWREWSEVSTNPCLMKSARSLANSPLSDGLGTKKHWANPQGGNRWCAAPVAGRGESTARTCSKVGARNATSAREFPATPRGKSIGGTLKSYLMTPIESGCLIEYLASFPDAIRRIAKCLNTMAAGGYKSFLSGAQGLMGVGNSCVTFYPYPDGIVRSWISIGKMSMEGMNRAISVSLPSQTTRRTNERSQLCSKRSMTYDIAFSGPRNRFTVATTAGPIIVHNCGYGLGFIKFAKMIYVGMLGMKGITFDVAFVKALNVDVLGFYNWITGKEDMLARIVEDKPAALTMAQWIMHVACAQQIISTFREGAPQVTAYWKLADQALYSMVSGNSFALGGPTGSLMYTDGTNIILPNGMPIRYEGLERNEDGEYSYLRRKEGRIQRVKTYGGSVVENMTQALARIVITDAMSRIERELKVRVALQVHDEVVVAAPAERAKEVQSAVRKIMQTPPAWAPDLPLDSEGSVAFRYGEAK